MCRIVFGAFLLLHACFITRIIGSPLEREPLTLDSTDTSNTVELTKVKTDVIENATKSSINSETNDNNIQNENEEHQGGTIANDKNYNKSESTSSVTTVTSVNNSGVNSSPNSSVKSDDYYTRGISITDIPKNATIGNGNNITSENDTFLGGHDRNIILKISL